MDPVWKTAIKITGSVGGVGLLISIMLEKIYSQEIISLFGDERVFYITVLLICVLSVALLTAVIIKQKPKDKGATVTYRDNSIHNGDNRF